MSRKIKIAGALATGGVLTVAAGIALVRYMGGAATGTVHVGTPATSSVAPTKPAQALALDTPYFTATLPAGFVLKQNNATPNADVFLLQLMADTASTTDQQFAVTIGVTPTGGISETSDYHLHTTQTDTYAPYHSAYLSTGAVAFRTISGPAAITLFWPHGNKYAEITLSTQGVSTESKLAATTQQALASWQWK